MPNKHPDNFIYVCLSATAQLENVQYYGVLLENKKTVFFFNHLFGWPKANSELEWYAKWKNYMLKMMLKHPNLATNVTVALKLFLLLITTLSWIKNTIHIRIYLTIYLTQANVPWIYNLFIPHKQYSIFWLQVARALH